MKQIERIIAERFVRAALGRGLTISVNDSEETTLHQSADAMAIYDAMWSTDDDTLIIFENGQRLGYVWFVWGNNEDVITDYGYSSEYAEKVLDDLTREAIG